MNDAHRFSLFRALSAGSCASILSAAVLLVAGRKEAGSAAAPINAVSHWYWDREALHQQKIDVRHTAAGFATHHAASIFWATLLAAVLHGRPQLSTPSRLVVASAATSAIACFVDFKLTPRRLTPGFEHRVSRKSLAVTYLMFAAGLALGLVAVGQRQRGN